LFIDLTVRTCFSVMCFCVFLVSFPIFLRLRVVSALQRFYHKVLHSKAITPRTATTLFHGKERVIGDCVQHDPRRYLHKLLWVAKLLHIMQ